MNDNIVSSSKDNSELKEQLNDVNKSVLLEIGAATQKFTSSNEVLKKELDNINHTIQSELRSIEQQFSSAKQNIETEIQSNSNE